MMDYLKNRLAEHETKVALGGVVLGTAAILFPQYTAIINMVGMVFGVTVAAAPTSKPLF